VKLAFGESIQILNDRKKVLTVSSNTFGNTPNLVTIGIKVTLYKAVRNILP
jgi:hypothetical protein